MFGRPVRVAGALTRRPAPFFRDADTRELSDFLFTDCLLGAAPALRFCAPCLTEGFCPADFFRFAVSCGFCAFRPRLARVNGFRPPGVFFEAAARPTLLADFFGELGVMALLRLAAFPATPVFRFLGAMALLRLAAFPTALVFRFLGAMVLLRLAAFPAAPVFRFLRVM